MATPNMSLPAADIDKSVVIGTLPTAELNEADYFPFYDSSATGAKQRKISVSGLTDFLKNLIGALPAATATDVGRAVVVNALGKFILGPAVSEEKVDVSITSEMWYALTNEGPFTWYADVTVSQTINNNSTVELLNNDPVVFSEYGICIGALFSGGIRFYARKKPTETLSMKVSIHG